ncbi:SDR family NAD(P)-dependent oxidoreductase [Leadbetterella byssophila]|uniref:SDR family NAD(P)-dependent oxidoreductase n=1 Tax=Leadbetterella byssophila TaxID=316068 RepID=UPI0039A28827
MKRIYLIQFDKKVIIKARNQPHSQQENMTFIAADLSKVDGALKVGKEAITKYGRIDFLINNLGSSDTPGGGFAVLSNAAWEETLQTNLLAPVRLDKVFFPQMLENKSGVIVHIAPASKPLLPNFSNFSFQL